MNDDIDAAIAAAAAPPQLRMVEIPLTLTRLVVASSIPNRES